MLATFGRGFYILDDYSPLRQLSEAIIDKDIHLFDITPAKLFIEDEGKFRDSKGDDYFRAPNKTYGACFTYYVKEAPKSLKDIRKEKEAEAEKAGKDITYPANDELRKEDLQTDPYLLFTIKDNSGFIVRQLTSGISAGMNRIYWDLKYPDTSPLNKSIDANKNAGMAVMPGKYTVSISKFADGLITELIQDKEFEVKLLNELNMDNAQYAKIVNFQKEFAEFQRVFFACNESINKLSEKTEVLKSAALSAKGNSKEILTRLFNINNELEEINKAFNGDNSISKRNGNQPPSFTERLTYVIWGIWSMITEPTAAQISNLNMVKKEFTPYYEKLKRINDKDIKDIETELEKIKAPYTPGRFPEWKN